MAVATSPLDPDANGNSCAYGRGIWSSVQYFVVFLATNIVAHAITIYLAPGTDLFTSVYKVYQALLLPVKAGDGASHAIWRYMQRSKTLRGSHVIGGSHFEDAVTAGAIAVVVPLQYAPLLKGRWDSVQHQRLVMLDNKKFWYGAQDTRREFKNLPFTINDSHSRYVPFILPPRTTFPDYEEYRIASQSNALARIVAIAQLVLSTWQLVLHYGDSMAKNGLASPFLVVVPYLLMTFINLVANVLVGSYPQVTVLPTNKEKLPLARRDNQVYIGNWDADQNKTMRVVTVAVETTKRPGSPASGTSTGSSDPQPQPEPNIVSPVMNIAQAAGQVTAVAEAATSSGTAAPVDPTGSGPMGSPENNGNLASEPTTARSSPGEPAPTAAEHVTQNNILKIEATPPDGSSNTGNSTTAAENQTGNPPAGNLPKSAVFEEYNGRDWVPFSVNAAPHRLYPGVQIDAHEHTRTPFRIPGIIRLEHREAWTSACHEISLKFKYGRRPPATPRDPENAIPLVEPSEARSQWRRCMFLKQGFISSAKNWNVRKRHLQGSDDAQEIRELRAWFEENYNGVTVQAKDWPKTVELQQLIKSGPRRSNRVIVKDWILNGKWGVGVLLLLAITGIVGGLTKMKIGNKGHACWLLLWLYGGPVVRWHWLFTHSFDKEPCQKLWKWFIFEFCQLLLLLLPIAVYCGITVICVELFAAFCGGPDFTISLHPQYWIAVGAAIAAFLFGVGLGIAYFKTVVEALGGLFRCCTSPRKETDEMAGLSRSRKVRIGKGIWVLPHDD